MEHERHTARLLGYVPLFFVCSIFLFVAIISIGIVSVLLVPTVQSLLFYQVDQNTCEAFSAMPSTQKIARMLPEGWVVGGGYQMLAGSGPNFGRWEDFESLRLHYDMDIHFRWFTVEIAPVFTLQPPHHCR